MKKVDTIEQKWTLSAKSGHNQAKVDTIGQKWTAQQFNATIFTWHQSSADIEYCETSESSGP